MTINTLTNTHTHKEKNLFSLIRSSLKVREIKLKEKKTLEEG